MLIVIVNCQLAGGGGIGLLCSHAHSLLYVINTHPFSLFPSLSVLSCPSECNIATTICQIVQHLKSSSPSCWFTFHSVFSNFMQKSIVSQNMANSSMIPLLNRVQYLPVFVYSLENFFVKPADLLHSSPYPHFKGF